MLEAGRRSLARILVATLFAVAAGSIVLLMAAKAAQHEARIVERLRPACDHSGFTPVELVRLVRSESRAFANKDEAVRSLTLFCQAHH